MTAEASVPPEIRDALNHYAEMGLIESWRYVDGRGFVLEDGGGHELKYRTPAEVRKAALLLEGVETALLTGKAQIGTEGGSDDG